MLNINPWLKALPPYALTKNEALKESLTQKGLCIYDFTLGDPLEPTPSFIKKALIENFADVSQYPANMGSAALRKACAQWLRTRFDVGLDPHTQILSTNGSKEALFHIPQVLFNSESHKKTVIFPEPGFPVYNSSTILAGGTPYAHVLKSSQNYKFNPNDIPAEILSKVAAVWVSYPHNPTGATISVKRMEEIYQWALLHNIIVLSDECYVDMFFEGSTPPPTFLSVAKENNYKNVMCFYSLSKRSGMTGYRSGFVAGDSELMAAFAKYRLNVGAGTPDFVQHAAIAAWSETTHVQERNKLFAQKRVLADAFFAKNNISVLPSSSTFYVWGTAPACYNSGKEFADAVSQTTGIIMTPGEAFGPSCTHNFRLALVPSCENMQKAFSLWQQKIEQGVIRI